MYRFVSTILDENEEVRKYAEMCLVSDLIGKELLNLPNLCNLITLISG